MSEKLIVLENICKSFGEQEVLHDFNLYIKENEFVTLLGPSGCGKTTLLRMIGGFDQPTSGKIYFDGKVINDLEPNKREINTVFQRYALFPHLNVYDNVAFGLKLKKIPDEKNPGKLRKYTKAEIEKEVMRSLKLVHLDEYSSRKIDTLSGGQMQRVAMARAIVMKPKLLLLDEPLAALDRKLRQDLQYELKEMQRTLGITFLFVTHDQEEALTMSDTIVVMNEGRILQIGSPEQIYNEPTTRFVANFIGESNIIDATVPADNTVKFENALFKTTYKGFSKNEEVDVVLRPEDIEIIPAENAKIKGVIDSKVFKGEEFEINVIVESGKEYTIHTTKNYELGLNVGLTVDPENITIMKKPGINVFSGVIEDTKYVRLSDDVLIEYIPDEEEPLEDGKQVVVRINTADVLLDDIEESDFEGVIKDIKQRDLYFDVYIKVGNQTIVSSTSRVHHIGENIGIWIKEEKVLVTEEKEEELSNE
ncbi:MAG: ABC transporter ATP-binding protein [Gammaproteobacteria bacterium]|nr:ABC transporter ATP-binding protein [Gammaproteobacteria bacterium]